MGGQRHVLAQLPQELAFAAAEAVGFAARRDENAEDIAFSRAAEPRPARTARRRQPLREREADFIQVWLIDERAADAARQPVDANLNLAALIQVQCGHGSPGCSRPGV